VTSFNEEGYRVDPRFSFTREGERLDAEERRFWVNRLIKKQKWDAEHPLIRALYRGIGVHHGSLPKAYKDLVETLFRSKKLKVILASGTLALGVNMPARTTIFIHDSRFLEPIAVCSPLHVTQRIYIKTIMQ
jgi:replicative superfamily II helicase